MMSTTRGRKPRQMPESEIVAPALGKTIQRLRKAYNMSLGDLSEHSGVAKSIISQIERNEANPILESQDGLCRLAIFGPLDLVEYMQWYDFTAEPGGVLESEPHQPGCIEHLYILEGEIEVTCGDDVKLAKTGEALRYRGDRPHRLRNTGDTQAHATMIMVLGPPVLAEER